MLGAVVLALVAPILCAVATAWVFLKRRHGYWRNRGVFGPPPSFPFGNFKQVAFGRRWIGDELDSVYATHRDKPYVGLFVAHTPVLQLHDLDLIQQVFVTEFADFNSRGMYCDPVRDPLSANLTNLSGEAWRSLHAKLSPAFSPGKVRFMFDTMASCALNLREFTLEQTAGGKDGCSFVADVKEIAARYSTDVICSVAFGLDSDCMRNPEAPFRRWGRRALAPGVVGLRLMLSFFAHDVMRVLRLSLRPPDVQDFFMGLVKRTVQMREEQGVHRADMIQLLLELRSKGFIVGEGDLLGQGHESSTNEEVRSNDVSIEQIAAQVFLFFLAGFETASSTTAFALYELAKHPDMQRKVLSEIDQAFERHNDKLTYDSISELKFMDQVVHETMRLYPLLPFLTRQALRDRTLPLTNLNLARGTIVIVPVRALHMDPNIWPKPNTFDPDRFSSENRKCIPTMAYMPFGEGPRTCIGRNLGLMQVKLALAYVLSAFTVQCCPESPECLQMDPRSPVPTPTGGIPLSLVRRSAGVSSPLRE